MLANYTDSKLLNFIFQNLSFTSLDEGHFDEVNTYPCGFVFSFIALAVGGCTECWVAPGSWRCAWLCNDTEVLSLPVASSPLFSVFGLNPKGPEAFSDAWFFVP